ncbi:MAG: hypothetical protein JOY63_16890 [Acetobacteraceae bacterium]|nr:hypothetical protein [Acetobacteraceae bacterium]
MATAAQVPTLTTLASFNGLNGLNPYSGLAIDSNGDLFGTTSDDGPNHGGTVFEIAKTAFGYASAPITLVRFNGIDGAFPLGGLILDSNGDLFGTTEQGGANGQGTAFEIPKTASGYASAPTTLASFAFASGAFPVTGLTADANGDLFGTTEQGGAGTGGSVFEIAKTPTGYANAPTTLVSFNGVNGNSPDTALTIDANGDLFGTTSDGGSSGGGTVYEIVKTASGYASAPTTLASFKAPELSTPQGSLIFDASGDLFGTRGNGGSSGYGSVFEIAKTASGYANTPTTLVSFNGPNGATPHGGLTADGNGDLFGTTEVGGPNNDGTVYEIVKTAFGYANTPTTLASFDGADGITSDITLIADANGDLVGTAVSGGPSNDGTVFELTPPYTFLTPPYTFEVWDITRGINYNPLPVSTSFADRVFPDDRFVVAALRPGVFIQTGTGDDLLAAQSGGDNVLVDGGGLVNFEIGGLGRDAYFFDAGHDPLSWNTIVGLHAGDFAAIFGIGPQDVAAGAADGLGAPGYTGLTLRMAAQGGGEALVTLAGYDTGALRDGRLLTAFGTDPANGREYMLIQAM